MDKVLYDIKTSDDIIFPFVIGSYDKQSFEFVRSRSTQSTYLKDNRWKITKEGIYIFILIFSIQFLNPLFPR